MVVTGCITVIMAALDTFTEEAMRFHPIPDPVLEDISKASRTDMDTETRLATSQGFSRNLLRTIDRTAAINAVGCILISDASTC